MLVEIPPLERVKIKKDAPFTFTATVEIKPKIELRDYKAPIPSPQTRHRTVTDEQVEKAIEVLREHMAQIAARPGGNAIVRRGLCGAGCWRALGRQPARRNTKEGQLHKVGSHAARLGHRHRNASVGKKEGETI